MAERTWNGDACAEDRRARATQEVPRYPGIGIMHADLQSRDSLACDLMEPVRPTVDAFLLDFLKGRAFKKNEFFETREGVCRLMPSLTKELMTTGPRWAKDLGPVVEGVARRLFDANSRRSDSERKSRHHTIPTLLTEPNRSRGRRWYPKKEPRFGVNEFLITDDKEVSEIPPH